MPDADDTSLQVGDPGRPNWLLVDLTIPPPCDCLDTDLNPIDECLPDGGGAPDLAGV